MTQVIDIKDDVEQELEELISRYGYEEKKEAIFEVIRYDYILLKGTHISNKAIELIDLIKFIRKSHTQRIELQNNAQSVDVPNLIALDIEKYLNILLNEYLMDKYENDGIAYREAEEAPIGYIEPYSDKELNLILTKEKRERVRRNTGSPREMYKVKGKTDQFKNPYFGKIFVRWYDAFADLGLIQTEIDSNGCRIRKDSRRLYQFFYDCMATIGKFKPLDDIDIKYDKVRACIKSYDVR